MKKIITIASSLVMLYSISTLSAQFVRAEITPIKAAEIPYTDKVTQQPVYIAICNVCGSGGVVKEERVKLYAWRLYTEWALPQVRQDYQLFPSPSFTPKINIYTSNVWDNIFTYAGPNRGAVDLQGKRLIGDLACNQIKDQSTQCNFNLKHKSKHKSK